MHVMGFGTYNVEAHPRVGVLLQGLADLGVTVTEMNFPLRLDTADRVRMLKRPWNLPKLLLELLSRWARLAQATMRLRLSAKNAPDALLVGYMGHFDVLLARLLFPRTPLALDMLIFGADTARDRGEHNWIKLALLRRLDQVAMAAADVVIVDTDENVKLVPQRVRRRAFVAAVGATEEWHRAWHPTSKRWDTSSPLSVVFFGMYTPLQGAPTIGRAIHALDSRSDIRFTMVGKGQDYEETRAAVGDATNVQWIDWLEADQLRRLVADSDVCLGIFGTTAKALHVVPNKVYQGAAVGCAVVTSDTAPQRRMLEDAAVFVPPGDSAALTTALEGLLSDPDEVAKLRQRARQHAEANFTPAAVAQPLYERLTSAVALGSPEERTRR